MRVLVAAGELHVLGGHKAVQGELVVLQGGISLHRLPPDEGETGGAAVVACVGGVVEGHQSELELAQGVKTF